MNTSTLAATAPRVSLLRCYALEAKHEFLRLLRSPSFALPSLLFPPMFYLLFGVLLRRGDGDGAAVLFTSYSVFGVMAPGLFGFGVSLAMDRERGWMTLRRALPLPPGAYLMAKMAMAMGFAAVIYVLLALLAVTLGGVHMAGSSWALVGMTAVLGVLPFCALGLLVGSRVSATAAPAVVNFIYLPMAFLSGLWLPLSLLPAFVRTVAPLWPSYHLAQLAQQASARAHEGDLMGHLAYLLVFTAGCAIAAHRALARRT